MNRITRRLSNNIIEFVDGKGYGNLNHNQGVKLLFERLAEYEDTQLSPEEVLSLITTIESQKEEIEKLNEIIRTLGLSLQNSV